MKTTNAWFRLYPYDETELAKSHDGQALLSMVTSILDERDNLHPYTDVVETDTGTLSCYLADLQGGASALHASGLPVVAAKAGVLLIIGDEGISGRRAAHQDVYLPDGRSVRFSLDGRNEPALLQETVQHLNAISSTPEEAFVKLETYLALGQWTLADWQQASDEGVLTSMLNMIGHS